VQTSHSKAGVVGELALLGVVRVGSRRHSKRLLGVEAGDARRKSRRLLGSAPSERVASAGSNGAASGRKASRKRARGAGPSQGRSNRRERRAGEMAATREASAGGTWRKVDEEESASGDAIVEEGVQAVERGAGAARKPSAYRRPRAGTAHADEALGSRRGSANHSKVDDNVSSASALQHDGHEEGGEEEGGEEGEERQKEAEHGVADAEAGPPHESDEAQLKPSRIADILLLALVKSRARDAGLVRWQRVDATAVPERSEHDVRMLQRAKELLRRHTSAVD